LSPSSAMKMAAKDEAISFQFMATSLTRPGVARAELRPEGAPGTGAWALPGNVRRAG
jgi:hypothetical protein